MAASHIPPTAQPPISSKPSSVHGIRDPGMSAPHSPPARSGTAVTKSSRDSEDDAIPAEDTSEVRCPGFCALG